MSSSRMPRPAARYGERTGRAPVAYVVVAVVAALGVGWAAWAGFGSASDPVSGQIQGYSVLRPRVVQARLVVTAPADTAVACTLRALDADRSVIGRASVTLPAGTRTRGTVVEIRVLTTVSSVELVGCSAAAST